MKYAKILFVLGSLIPVFVGAQDKIKAFEVSGYMKFMQTLSISGQSDLKIDNLWHNRLNGNYSLSKNSSLVAQFRNRLFYGDLVNEVINYGTLVNEYDGAIDMQWSLVDNSNVVLSVIADRFYYQAVAEKLEFRLGRQRINWGINTTWNPNDIFNSYNIYDFDYEEREGSDAIRLKYFPNYQSSLDLAYKFTGQWTSDVFSVMYKFNKFNYDYQFFAGKYIEKLAFGGGWAGSIHLIGFKGEVTYFLPYNSYSSQNLSLSTSFDYSWSNGAYGMLTYLYNSSGSNDIVDPTIEVQVVPTAEYLMPAMHNIMGSYSHQLSPISTLNASIIYGIAQNSLIFFPTYTVSLKENLDLDLIAQFFFQELPDEHIKNIGNGFYWRLKMSF